MSPDITNQPPTNKDLRETTTMDFSHPRVDEFIRRNSDPAASNKANASQLFTAVRDHIRYTPYRVTVRPEYVAASHILETRESYCIPKALLYAATLRAIGIPARIGLADVTNHLSSQRLKDMLQSEEFVGHGYTVAWIEGRWVRATPTFDSALCRRMGVDILAFNGEEDALFSPFDKQGNKYMEYLRYHGEFDIFEPQLALELWKGAYPHWFDAGFDFYDDQSFGQDEVF